MKVLDAIYAPFKMKESDFSQRNLMWLKIFSLIAIPGPFSFFLTMQFTNDFIDAPIILALASVPIIAMAICLMQRPINTLTRTNKNLDEWEQGLKYRSESFAYRVALFSMLFLCTALLIVDGLQPSLSFTVSLMDLVLLMGTFVLAMLVTISNFIAWTVTPFGEDHDEEMMMVREKKVKNIILIVALIVGCLTIFPALFAVGWMGAHHSAGHEGLF